MVAALAASAAGMGLATITATSSANQVSRHSQQPIVLTSLRPMVFDRNILALDVAGLAQSLTKRRDEARVCCEAAEKSDYRHCWNRPCARRGDAA